MLFFWILIIFAPNTNCLYPAKRARFTKVASARVTKIINYLGLLQNCSNRNNYEYDSDDVELMFAEIGKALRDAKAAYSNELNKQSGKGGFSFKK